MELQVLTQRDNPLLKRTEITFKAIHKAEPTPTRDAIRSELAKQLKASKDVVVVDHAKSSFGRFETHGYAKIYASKEGALAVERTHILVRNRLKEAEVKKKEGGKAGKPAKAEKPVPKVEPKPEPPKPEKKEEKPTAKEERKPAETHEKKEEKPEPKKAEPKKAEPKKAEPKKKETK
jgi:small subunit ribosomal protein S24e